MRLAGPMLLVLFLSGIGVRPQAAPPDDDAFLQRVRAALRLDEDLQKDFTFLERRHDVKVSALGKVTVGPLRTFEVFPSIDPGRTFKRLIAIEGRALDAAELARRDAEHRRDLEAMGRESPAQRGRRLERAERERSESREILADALAVFAPTVTGRDAIGGEPVLVVSLKPRPDARVQTREGSWMKQFEGRAWFVERDGQLARLEMQAFDDVSIGWGIVGRIHRGTRLFVERRPVGGLWLPARLEVQASGRTLLFRLFQVELRREYSEYRKKQPAVDTGDTQTSGVRRRPPLPIRASAAGVAPRVVRFTHGPSRSAPR